MYPRLRMIVSCSEYNGYSVSTATDGARLVPVWRSPCPNWSFLISPPQNERFELLADGVLILAR